MISHRTATWTGAAWTVAALLILAGLALWWRYGELVALAGPGWMCAPR